MGHDTDDVDRIWIQSSADPTTGRPMCLVVWGGKQKMVATERIIATARELFGAAAAAETDLALLRTFRSLRLPDEVTVTAMRQARQERQQRRMPDGARPVFRISAMVGATTGLPLVSVALGSNELTMDTADARQTASDWYETAVAAILDVRIRHTLAGHDFDRAAVEAFMTDLFGLNPEVSAGDSPLQ